MAIYLYMKYDHLTSYDSNGWQCDTGNKKSCKGFG